jgi:hypothetical protein
MDFLLECSSPTKLLDQRSGWFAVTELSTSGSQFRLIGAQRRRNLMPGRSVPARTSGIDRPAIQSTVGDLARMNTVRELLGDFVDLVGNSIGERSLAGRRSVAIASVDATQFGTSHVGFVLIQDRD